MLALRARRLSGERAAALLCRVFGPIEAGFAFRLWDGTEVSLGRTKPVCTVVVHAPETFIRLMRDPTPLNFAEAYVESAVDIEGDLFAAMKVANAVEELKLPMGKRLRIYASMWASLWTR